MIEQLNEEQLFYLREYAKLKEEEKALKTKLSEMNTWFKEYLESTGLDFLEDEEYQIKKYDTTSSEIDAVDLLREIGVKIPVEGEQIINDLFKVNLTTAKNKLGALALNKMLREGKTNTQLRLVKK